MVEKLSRSFLVLLMRDFGPTKISSARDAEQFAVRHMEELGFLSVQIHSETEERAVDIESQGGYALVRHDAAPVTLPVAQQVRGIDGIHSDALLYSLNGFTSSALAFGEERDVALFRYSADGTLKAQSSSARRLLEYGRLPIAPGLSTMARDDFDQALVQYGGTVVAVAEAIGPVIQSAVDDIVEWEGGLDEEAQERAKQTSRDSQILAGLLAEMNGEHEYDQTTLIRNLQRIEVIMHRMTERWGIAYDDLELDVSVVEILEKRSARVSKSES
ncbi:hypothetical protein [Homoserinimonas sp. A520]